MLILGDWVTEKVAATTTLEAGTADYVRRLYALAEVVARVQTVLRRTGGVPDTPGTMHPRSQYTVLDTDLDAVLSGPVTGPPGPAGEWQAVIGTDRREPLIGPDGQDVDWAAPRRRMAADLTAAAKDDSDNLSWFVSLVTNAQEKAEWAARALLAILRALVVTESQPGPQWVMVQLTPEDMFLIAAATLRLLERTSEMLRGSSYAGE